MSPFVMLRESSNRAVAIIEVLCRFRLIVVQDRAQSTGFLLTCCRCVRVWNLAVLSTSCPRLRRLRAPVTA